MVIRRVDLAIAGVELLVFVAGIILGMAIDGRIWPAIP